MREGFRALLASVGGILITLGVLRAISGAWSLSAALIVFMLGLTFSVIAFFTPYFKNGQKGGRTDGG